MGTMEAKDAAKYLIDPLTEPEPHAESGLNTHYTSTFSPKPENSYPTPPQSASPKRDNNPFHPSPKRETNPFRRSIDEKNDRVNVTTRDQLSPPVSGSPHHQKFPAHRDEASVDHMPRERRSLDRPSQSQASNINTATRRRGNSLKERYPGDNSTQPLSIIRRESKKAHRSPHLSKRHMPGADMVDRLDIIGGRYHHEGPYDAALLARNTSHESSPLAAVSDSIKETLKATPSENINNSVKAHHPLDGTAVVPPGEADRYGRTFQYKEDGNMMVDNDPSGGGYRRWPGVEYKDDDIHGKGEPFYSLEQAVKNHKISDEAGEEHGAIELTDTSKGARASSSAVDPRDTVDTVGSSSRMVDLEHDAGVRHSSSTASKGDGFRKRFGSLRKKKNVDG